MLRGATFVQKFTHSPMGSSSPTGKRVEVGLAKRAVQRHFLEGALHHRQLLIV